MPCGQTVPGRKLAALAMELEVWQPFFCLWNNSAKEMKYIETLKKNVNLTVSKCSYSNHQCVVALREAILASLRIQTWKTYPGCTSTGSVIYVRHGGVPQQQFVCFSKLLYICIRYSILSFNTPSKIEMPRSFGKKHVQWNRNTVMSWTVPGGWDDLRINMVV